MIEMLHAFFSGGLEIAMPQSAPVGIQTSPRLVLKTVIQADGDAMFMFDRNLLAMEASQSGLSPDGLVQRHFADVAAALVPMRDIEAFAGLCWSVAFGLTAVVEAVIIPWSHMFTLAWLALHWPAIAADVAISGTPIGVRLVAAPLVRWVVAGRFAKLDRKTLERSLVTIKQ
jgi:hypothetical protein